MITAAKPLLDLTAADVMTPDGVELTEDMPLREAARLIVEHQITGAAVIDADGKCVGVLSAIDFLRHALTRPDVADSLAPPLPKTCSFQKKHKGPHGEDVTLCTLPPGVCPIQMVTKETPEGPPLVVCRQPHCVLSDWQVVNMEQLPTDAVRNYMTPDPVMVPPTAPIRDLARRMIDAHIHRVIVADEAGKPLGIVASTDLLAALAYAEDDPE